MNSLHLHRQLTQAFATIGLKATPKQRANLALLCQTLALGLPLMGCRENLIQHLRRTLKNEQLRSTECYQPLVQYLFAHWLDGDVNLVMDRTDLENRFSILTLGVAYQKRLLPLAWQVLNFGSTRAAEQTALLQRIQPALPHVKPGRVSFYADSEFRGIALQQVCQGYGWHWPVGLKSDWWFRSPASSWQTLRTLDLHPGERRYLSGVYLTHEHEFGPLNLMADWSPNQETPRY